MNSTYGDYEKTINTYGFTINKTFERDRNVFIEIYQGEHLNKTVQSKELNIDKTFDCFVENIHIPTKTPFIRSNLFRVVELHLLNPDKDTILRGPFYEPAMEEDGKVYMYNPNGIYQKKTAGGKRKSRRRTKITKKRKTVTKKKQTHKRK